MNLEFSEQERSILRDICDIQITSFYDILRGNLLKEDEELLLQYQSSLEEAKREAKWKIGIYSEIIKEPRCMAILEESDISTMRHILFHMEEVYILKYPKGVKDLWVKFFTIEAYRSPSIKLITNKLKSHGKPKIQKTKVKVPC